MFSIPLALRAQPQGGRTDAGGLQINIFQSPPILYPILLNLYSLTELQMQQIIHKDVVNTIHAITLGRGPTPNGGEPTALALRAKAGGLIYYIIINLAPGSPPPGEGRWPHPAGSPGACPDRALFFKKVWTISYLLSVLVVTCSL